MPHSGPTLSGSPHPSLCFCSTQSLGKRLENFSLLRLCTGPFQGVRQVLELSVPYQVPVRTESPYHLPPLWVTIIVWDLPTSSNGGPRPPSCRVLEFCFSGERSRKPDNSFQSHCHAEEKTEVQRRARAHPKSKWKSEAKPELKEPCTQWDGL